MKRDVESVFMVSNKPIISLVFILVALCSRSAIAQFDIPLGTWRTHFNYTDIKKVVAAPADGRVYAATANALVYLDESDNSIHKLTKIDGLADAGISSLSYSSSILSIGYQSGRVDFIKGNDIVGFSQLATTPQLVEKAINAVLIHQNRAYLATSIGIVVVNLATNNIIESYTQIGPGASNILVRDIAIVGDSIFLATPKGLLAASLAPQFNLQDFNNWKLKFPNVLSRDFQKVIRAEGELWLSTQDALWAYRSGTWRNLAAQLPNLKVKSIESSGTETLIIAEDPSGFTRLLNGTFGEVYTSADRFSSAARLNSKLFLATNEGIKVVVGSSSTKVALNGPFTDMMVGLNNINNVTYAFARAINSIRQPIGNLGKYSIFREAEWQTIELPQLTDITAVAGGKMYFSSYGSGVYNVGDNILITDKSAGSPLIAGPPPATGPLITDIFLDEKENLWVANYDANPALHVLQQSGGWRSIVLGSTITARYPMALSVSRRSGIVWVTMDPVYGGGIYVHSPSDNLTRYVSRTSNSLPSNIINTLVIDKKDEVWIGTDNGVAFFPASNTPFAPDFNRALIPIFDGAELLKNQFVTQIAIDGGNRKWIGTRQGLWVYTENGDQLVHRFTTQNSPLPSDTILAISANGKNGEVFIATTKGLVSYRTDATDASAGFGMVKVFPNPVPPNYTGTIGIEGLGNNVNVKVTDISGNLVREMDANGGSAAWDGLDSQGRKVATGTYFIFASNADGTASFVGKFAVIR